MTPLFPAQRAAEEFDQVLSGSATPAATDRYAGLLDTVALLRTHPEVQPRPEFVDDLRSRLMTAAESELVAAPSVVRHLTPVRSPRTHRRLGALAASLVIIGGSAGVAAAASGSLPGEGLYPVKRGVEQAEAAVRRGDAGKGKALLDQAATRLDEVQSLQDRGSSDTDLMARTIDSFRTSAEAGADRLFRAYQADGDTADVTTVRTFAAQQMTDLAALSGDSATTDAALLDAADALADIDQQARVLCAACGPREGLEPPTALSAGAGKATVDNLLARPVAQAAADIQRVEVARLAALDRLKAAAEKSAGQVPRIDPADLTPGGTAAAADNPVTSTITPDGRLVPSLTSGVAVKDLVSGVTTSLEDLTGKVTGGQTPLDDTVKGVTGTVDGLTGTVDGVTKDLTDTLGQGLLPSPRN